GERPSIYWGYVLYGMLMQKVDRCFADYMHEQNLKPLCQHVICGKNNTAEWRINLLNEASAEAVIPIFRDSAEWYSGSKGTSFRFSGIELSKPISSKELCDKYFIDEKPKSNIEIIFKTPCSFKSDESYCIFPSAELTVKSLVNKWNAFTEDFVLDDEDALKELLGRTRIARYELKSVGYHIKGAVIPSFVGSIILSAKGPEPLMRLFNLIIAFAGYSGVGIKTALGMGGCEVGWQV
ncbi:MAG: CRISPR-associated endoribonuclease Cas6, partial [Clostridiales bacterium]|nr:CRISPR-associated endoribonuclease Cas6 [Clostridiales bacterium]